VRARLEELLARGARTACVSACVCESVLMSLCMCACMSAYMCAHPVSCIACA
jgi:hypothetical protein